MVTKATRLDAYRLFHAGILAFARAEQAGMRIDVEYCEKTKAELTKRIVEQESDFKKSNFYRHWEHKYGARTNIDSNFQLAEILYNIRKIEPIKTTLSGRGSTDEEALLQLNLPEIKPLIEIRKLRKLRDTYLDAFIREQVDGFIHPFFNLHSVRTGRSSSDSPNWQNLPSRDEEAMNLIRRALFARFGHQLGDVDYSGIEVKIACCETQDPKLIEDVLHGDMHRDMAIELYMLDSLDKKHSGEYNLRQGGKNGFVFPEFYGDYYGNCATNLLDWARRGSLKDGTPAIVHLSNKGLIKLDKAGNIRSMEKFEEHVKDVEDSFWNKRYKVYKQWKDRKWSEYQKNGYLDSLTGFRFSGLMKKNEVTNAPIQCAAFHCLLQSFVWLDEIQRAENWDSRLIGQIHDAINLDIHPPERDHVMTTVRRVTCQDLPAAWKWIIIPLEIEASICPVDGSWNQKKPYEFKEIA